ncbi:MAG TPA: CvpA family protein [Rhizomicrobium sp.]|nr:CvpA family protein [Rhizomicrobium sp.]
MSDLQITWVDLAVVAILTLSTGFALFRGFVREILSVIAWAAAAFATLYFGRYVVPLMAPHFSPVPARIMAYSAVFLVVLLPLLFIAARFSRRIYEAHIGGLDRVLGALFGVVRGLAVIGVLYMLYSLVMPIPAQAQWMKQARTLPLIQRSADALVALLPEDDARVVKARMAGKREAQAHGSDAAPVASDEPRQPVRHTLAKATKSVHKGYGAADRRALNRLIQATDRDGGKP